MGIDALDAWLSVCPPPWPLGRQKGAPSCKDAVANASGVCPTIFPWDFTFPWIEGDDRARAMCMRERADTCRRAAEFIQRGKRMGTLTALDIYANPFHVSKDTLDCPELHVPG